MKIILTKNIEIYSAETYLRFKIEEERQDIQDYLNGTTYFENEIIQNRVKEYLKNIGIYDEKGALTKKGTSAKETGKIRVWEEGKYQIWFSQKDSFFGNKIFYFRRLEPKKDNHRIQEISLDKKGHFLLPTKENDYTKIELETNEIYVSHYDKVEILNFSWVWEGLEKSHYNFSGTSILRIEKKDIPSDEDIKQIITEILPNWSNEQNRYRIKFEDIREEAKMNFEGDLTTKDWKNFDISLKKLPLMPYDKENATLWRNFLLNKEAEKDYLTQTDFEKITTELNNKEALKCFKLDIPKVKDFAGNEKNKTFWHLNAPSDLNPR